MSDAPAALGEREQSDPGAETLKRVVFAALVLACAAAFFITQRLKHTPTAVQRFERTPRFSPYRSGRHKLEQISFKIAHADSVTVSIVDARGDVTATLVRGLQVPRYKQISLRWNGRKGTAHRYSRTYTPSGRTVILPHNTGRLAPPGEYRVRVSLRHEGRSVLSPWSFTLVAP